MNIDEIRLRQLQGQRLIAPGQAQELIRGLCGVQAQFLSNAMHALRIRCGVLDAVPENWVKGWTLRGTMHVFAQEDLGLFLHEGRRVQLRPCDTMESDARISRERKRYFADLIVDKTGMGMCTREELKEACAEHGMTEGEAESLFNPWGGVIRALCESGRICHAVQEKKAYRLCPAFEPMAREAAELELARRYFTNYGPATLKDASYFFDLPQRTVKAWVDRLDVKSTACAGKTYFHIESGLAAEDKMPECIFLAGFDQLLMGHEKTESLFLPKEHLRGIFNLAGIVMPSVMVRGRIVGKWKRTGRRLDIALFEAVSPQDRQAMESCAHGLWPDLSKIEFA